MNLNLQTSACDPEQLESFLSGALSDADEREFSSHLNTCENCRRALQQQAAEPEAWMEAEKLLRPAEFDSPSSDEESESATLKQSARQPLQIQNVLAALGPTDDPEMLGRLGGYEVSGVVGAGGMGVVLKAIDKSLDRTVAIKVLAPHLASSGAARKRFAREAKAAAAVLHPNVIAIHSVSNDESLPYLVMPYVRGTSLQKRLDKEGPLSLQEILRIGSQIAAGLAAAHAQGLVHRDIKPANILMEDGVERVTITDFGLARAVDDASITRSGVIAGTPQYMSPEQARGEAVDGRSDLFSLGSVLYAICTGRPPFRAETSYGVMRRITDDEPTPIREINPEIPDWLSQIIARLMSKRAGERFASAAEISELFEKCLAHVQQPATVPLPQSCLSLRESSATFAERKATLFPRSLGVIAMIATLGLGLLGMVLWQATEAPDIVGKWTGEGWGEVVLEKGEPGEYEGTYTDTFKGKPGTMHVKWSRLEGRFNGTWQEGKDRFGKLSVRLVGDEIRGAWTTNKKSDINPGNPELADLLWKRSSGKKERPDSSHTQLTPISRTKRIDTEEKPQPGKIVVDLYAGEDVFKDQGARYQATVAKIIWSLNALPGVTVNIRPRGPGDSLTLAIVRDPYGVCRKEAQETRKASKLEAAINDAIHSGGLKAIRWEGDVLSGDAKVAQTPKSRDHDKELQATSNNPPRAVGDQAPNDIESLQVFNANQPPVRHLLPIGNVSKVSSEQGQVEVSLMKPGSVKVGDVLELSRPNPLRPGSYTRFARVRVVEVQKSDEAIIAVMTHSARQKVENRWEWRMPEAGDYVCLLVLKSEAEIPKPILEAEPKSKNSLPNRESESELQKFQGTWVLVSSEKDDEQKSEAKNPYRLTFTDTHWKVHRGDEVAVEGTLQLVDVTSTPRKFDLLKPKGLGPVPTVDYGIYEWKDDTLRYCVRNGPAVIGLPGMMGDSDLRPREFATRDGDGRMLYIWQRAVEGRGPGTVDSSSKEELRFSDTQEFVLSMDSLKFMLDLDTGKTMDPPATIRPEQEQMDVETDQVQPYHYPTKLIGRGLQGVEVKASDWDASAAEVRRALTGKAVEPLKEMDLGPEKNPTYFFKTKEGTTGVLQLLELVDKPKGIRLRYKTVAIEPESAAAKTTAESPKRLHDFPTGESVQAIAYSADGKLIAIAKEKDDGKRAVEIVDAGLITGKTVVSLQLTTKEEDAFLAAATDLPRFAVGPLAFSPAENVLAAGTGLGQVKIFDTRTGKLLQSLDDEKARLAEKTTPEKLKSFKRAMGSVTSLAFSHDGSLLAMTGSSFEDSPLVFDKVERGGLRRSVTGPGRLKVWEPRTGALKHDLVGHSHADAVSFSPDGNLLASAGRWSGADHGTGVIIWNTQTGKKLTTLLQEANAGTHMVVFSPTNKLVAIGSRQYDKENDTYTTAVSVAYALSGITEWKQTFPGWANPKAFSPDGKMVVTLCGGESIRFIKTETGEVQHEIKCADFLPATPRQGSQWFDFAITPTGPRLAIGGVDKERKGSVEIWDLQGLGAAQSAPAKEGERKDGK